MKKLFTFLLAIVFIMGGLSGCGSKEAAKEAEAVAPAQTEQAADAAMEAAEEVTEEAAGIVVAPATISLVDAAPAG